jgi:predicted unusual protein kinase regulating ubiquinone biosynthesis (AarF/ABC1/UbiB family)
MADWEEYNQDAGEDVPSGSWNRMFRIGSMGAKVGASSLAGKVRNFFSGDTDEIKEEQARELMRNNAEHVADVLGELKGASMKLGQLLSADPELLPDEFSEVIESLQKDAPPMTYDTAVQQIESSLGTDIDNIFDYFKPEPIGSASIGQVHRATLKTGEDVAVKIQYPGVIDALESDIKSLETLIVYGGLVADRQRLNEYMDEVREIILDEADYRNEALNMADFVDLLDEFDGVDCPKPFEEWTSKEVLVMEYVEGQKFDTALRDKAEGDRNELLSRWLELYNWLFHEKHYLHADPHPGNFLLDEDDTIWMLDFGCVKEFDPELPNGLLEIMVCCWEEDNERARELLKQLGFSTDESQIDAVDPDLLREYHGIVLEPFMVDEPFDFGSWQPATDGKKFMLENREMLKLVPPKDLILYFRLLSGIKGLLRKLDAKINVRQITDKTVRRTGLRD